MSINGDAPSVPSTIANLIEVAIVDDAFDIDASNLQLKAGEPQDLWEQLEFQDDAQAELTKVGLNVDGPERLDESMVAALRASRETCPKFDLVWQKSLVGLRLGARSESLDVIMGNLRGLGIKVRPFGAATPVKGSDMDGVQLVFLDWLLGEGDELETVGASIKQAQDLISSWPSGQAKPILILMSSSDRVLAKAEEFRKLSGILAGAFYAVAKRDLEDLFTLHLHLCMFAISMPAAHRVQRFVKDLKDEIGKAETSFVDGISELTLTDYAFIQRLSLQEDGHPLGDYLLWLFGSYFGHLLFGAAMKDARADLDSMRFEIALPSQGVPSLQLAKMYQAALFDLSVGPLRGHPRIGATEVSPPEVIAEPLLNLGDVFERITPGSIDAVAPPAQAQATLGCIPGLVGRLLPGNKATSDSATDQVETIGAPVDLAPNAGNAGPDLYMVINAQCDLVFAPGSKRSIEADRSIVLVPGVMQLIDKPLTNKTAPRTELFLKGEHQYRILWSTKSVVSVPYGKFHQWMKDQHLELRARLRLPFALEVQHAFAASLTRVGLPVAPPLYQPVQVQLLRSKAGKLVAVEGGGWGRAFTILTKDGSACCVFTLKLVLEIRDALAARRQELFDENSGNDQSTVDLQNAHTNVAAKINALDNALGQPEEWRKLRGEIDLPTNKPLALLNSQSLLKLCKGKVVSESATEDQPMLLVNLMTEESVDADASDDEGATDGQA
jgi:hypothetical protein